VHHKGKTCFQVDNTTKYEGMNSLKISNIEEQAVWVYKLFKIAINPSQKYSISGYVLTENVEEGSGAFIGIVWFNKSRRIGETITKTIRIGGKWTKVEMKDITPPPDAYSAVFIVGLNRARSSLRYLCL